MSITIAATGDLLAHAPVVQAARDYAVQSDAAQSDAAQSDVEGAGYDFRPMLARIRPMISGADLALCHLETPLSAADTQLAGYPTFNSPRQIADAYRWAGYDGCSTASNHSVDRGFAGVVSTLDVLDRNGLQHVGTARTAREANEPAIYRVRGVRIAHLSYTYGTNGIPVPSREPWSVAVTSVPTILAAAHRARAAGAWFVIVSMHWGVEYQVAPTAAQVAQARALLASPDIDLILGSHAHVQQPVQRIDGEYVVYGMGNLLSNQSPARGMPPQAQDGSVVTVHLSGTPGQDGGLVLHVDRVTYTATYCQIPGYRVLPAVQALADPATSSVQRAALTASLARTQAIQSLGVAQPEP